ncbi:MAG: hypothetical protein AB2794_21250, partial [Candidatus Thiodiazotropha endolucinida]
LVLETVDFMSLDGAKAPSPKSGEEVINKFQIIRVGPSKALRALSAPTIQTLAAEFHEKEI